MQMPSTRRNLAKASHYLRIMLCLAVAATCGTAMAQTSSTTGGVYQVTNILSDGYVSAANTDPNFIDPWGVAGTKTLWINTNVTGFSYVVPIVAPAPPTSPISFKSTIPPAVAGTGPGQPTGIVQNTTTGFILSNGTKASFLFATSDGTISGWNSLQIAPAYNALIEVNNTAKNAVYPDLALLTNTNGSYLLVPNFGQGADVEVYNTSFQQVTLAGSFADPNIPSGYAPYAIKVIGTQVFVTYMLRTVPPFATGAGTYQEILGTNTGFVSVFDVNGNFVARAVTGGLLNAPWGVTIAPAGFGIYAGDLLIGNFGDGLITAYNPTTYAYLGTVADGNGKAIAYPGLWEIFPNANGNASALYFTAGLAQETHGLFGLIANATTATSTPTFNLSTSSTVASVGVPASTALALSIAPSNSFTGTVTLSCSGLPLGTSCTFGSTSLAVSPNAPATTTLTLATQATYGELQRPNLSQFRAPGILLALLIPFGSMLAGRRRRQLMGLRVFGVIAGLVISTGFIVGCSNSSSAKPTPAGMSNVTVTATSGSITQSTVVALTVQ